MINTISKIQQFHKICTQWNSNYISTRDKTNQARFRIRESINQLHELIDIAEGNYRIELATLIRQYRESPIHQQDETGQNIINAIASYNFSNLKTEISTLNHIIERLLNEANHENFVDYKDNQIKPAFTRINRIVDYLNDSTKSQYSTIAAKIKNLIHILFGEDTQFIDDYQTIESGQQGLYSYLHQLLLLEQDRETYSKQLSNLFEKSNEILYQLNKSFTQQRSDMTIQVGKRIQYASYIIYAIAFILMAVFLIISTTILRVIKRQIKHTHEVNQQLKHQTNDLEIMNTTLHTEIEKRKESELALANSEERYRSLFETSRDGIVFLTLDECIETPNQAYLDLLGYSLEEIKNRPIYDFTPQKWHAIEKDIVQEVLTNGSSQEYEKEIVRKDGTIRTVLVSTWIVVDEKNKPIRLLRSLHDITDRKQLEESLHQKNIESERQQVMIKSIAAICHHLSQPLTAIWGTLSLLSRNSDINKNPDQKQLIVNCISATEEMSSLINQLRTIEEYKITEYTKLTEMLDIVNQKDIENPKNS
jgi:PAS domain S-box-containing protein